MKRRCPIFLGVLMLIVVGVSAAPADTATSAQRATAVATFTATAIPSPTPTATVPAATPIATVPVIHLPFIRVDMPAATATPTQPPTATLPPNTVAILPTYTWYKSKYSETLYVVGEVQNTTAQAVEYVRIPVNLFDAAGTLVDTDYTYAEIDLIVPGEKACFEIIVFDPPAWSMFQFEPVTFRSTDDALPALSVSDINAGIFRENNYRVLGQVRNHDIQRITYVQPIITLYDAAGMVLDCGSTFVQSTDLNPGQTSAFKLTFYSRTTYNDVATYRIAVDGNFAR